MILQLFNRNKSCQKCYLIAYNMKKKKLDKNSKRMRENAGFMEGPEFGMIQFP